MNILLHICCGVCAAGTASVLLSEGHSLTGYFYNPNIYPAEEYRRRLENAHMVAGHLGFRLVEGAYHHEEWLLAMKGLENETEGGRRCQVCYRLRLGQSYRFMMESGLEAFTTTLTISPHKLAAIINQVGMEVGGERFLQRDFKKKDGFKKAVSLAKEWDVYRQSYCGCIYSLKGGSK